MEGQGKTKLSQGYGWPPERHKWARLGSLIDEKNNSPYLFRYFFSQVRLRLKIDMFWPALGRKSLLSLLDTPGDDSSRFFFISIIWRPPKKKMSLWFTFLLGFEFGNRDEKGFQRDAGKKILKMDWEKKSLREILRNSKTSREAASSEREPSRLAVSNCEVNPAPASLSLNTLEWWYISTQDYHIRLCWCSLTASQYFKLR